MCQGNATEICKKSLRIDSFFLFFFLFSSQEIIKNKQCGYDVRKPGYVSIPYIVGAVHSYCGKFLIIPKPSLLPVTYRIIVESFPQPRILYLMNNSVRTLKKDSQNLGI